MLERFARELLDWPGWRMRNAVLGTSLSVQNRPHAVGTQMCSARMKLVSTLKHIVPGANALIGTCSDGGMNNKKEISEKQRTTSTLPRNRITLNIRNSVMQSYPLQCSTQARTSLAQS
eukprot:GHVR01075045.1.p1 GENE.GHVR01075045.1~~GHVR01075045.1.p1  ORF type:complete len:118 (-),score=6.30 GHVR01075045.1:94-447(-)